MNSSMANNSGNTHHRKKQITWEKRPQILRIGRIAKFNFAQLISDLTFLVWISYFYQELHSGGGGKEDYPQNVDKKIFFFYIFLIFFV